MSYSPSSNVCLWSFNMAAFGVPWSIPPRCIKCLRSGRRIEATFELTLMHHMFCPSSMRRFALYLIMNEAKFLKQQLNEMFAMAFAGRYCILLMALFSIYMGAIYNEFFSMPMSLFGPTKWL